MCEWAKWQNRTLRLHRVVNYETRGKYTDKGMSTRKLSGELSAAIMLQRSDPEFVKTVSRIRDSYHIFLRTTIQLDDVVKMCCDSDNVLRILTTLNLC